MADLQMDKVDVHDRKKSRRNVMKRKSNPIGKRKTIIIKKDNIKTARNFMVKNWL